jgi:hypothetical protein
MSKYRRNGRWTIRVPHPYGGVSRAVCSVKRSRLLVEPAPQLALSCLTTLGRS